MNVVWRRWFLFIIHIWCFWIHVSGIHTAATPPSHKTSKLDNLDFIIIRDITPIKNLVVGKSSVLVCTKKNMQKKWSQKRWIHPSTWPYIVSLNRPKIYSMKFFSAGSVEDIELSRNRTIGLCLS